MRRKNVLCVTTLCFFLLCTVPVSKTVGKALRERLREGKTAGELSISQQF